MFGFCGNCFCHGAGYPEVHIRNPEREKIFSSEQSVASVPFFRPGIFTVCYLVEYSGHMRRSPLFSRILFLDDLQMKPDSD
jgi:hypothetical protein